MVGEVIDEVFAELLAGILVLVSAFLLSVEHPAGQLDVRVEGHPAVGAVATVGVHSPTQVTGSDDY